MRRARTAPAGSRDGLSRTLRELATDLAISRRDCREKQDQIEALTSEIGRLRAPVSDPGDQLPAGSSGGGDGLGARRPQHEHTLAWMSIAVLVLRRGKLVLQEENASLRLELQRVRAREDRRSVLATAEDPR